MIKNRLEKNFKKLKSWAEKNKIEAYRLYDKDIPEFPFLIERLLRHLRQN
jgi:23S rRNA (cytosine1962-C5)-methyltransferase